MYNQCINVNYYKSPKEIKQNAFTYNIFNERCGQGVSFMGLHCSFMIWVINSFKYRFIVLKKQGKCIYKKYKDGVENKKNFIS